MQSRNWGLIVVLVAYVALALGFSLSTPPFEAPDEIHHYAFIRDLVRDRSLPVQHPGDRASQRHQPPLYYLGGALVSFWSAEPDDSPYSVARSNPYWGYAYGEVGRDNKNLYLHGAWDAFPYSGPALGIHIVRLLSVVLGALTVLAAHSIGLEVFPGRPRLALGGVALLAFNPMFLFISGSINNDNLIVLLVTLILLQLVRVLKSGLTARRALSVGVLIGLALLTKLTALYVIPVIALAFFLSAWPRRDWRNLAGTGAIAGAAALIIAGWWFARNMTLYGELTSINLTLQTWHARPEGVDWRQAFAELPNAETSFWGRFGYGNVPVPNVLYQGIGMLSRVGLYGCIALAYALVRSRYPKGSRERRAGRALAVAGWFGILFSHTMIPELGRLGRQIAGVLSGTTGVLAYEKRSLDADLWRPIDAAGPGWRLGYLLALLALTAAVFFAAMFTYMTMSTTAANGRYMFPGLPALSLLVFIGLAYYVPVRWRTLLATILPAGLAVLSLFVLLQYHIPAYAGPPVFEASKASPMSVPQNVNLDFAARARLLGIEIGPKRLRPGDIAEVTLFWQALQKMDENYAVTVQVFGRDRQRIGQRDSFPGLGAYPTTEWRPGELIVDRYRVPLDAAADAPTGLTIDVGLYRPETIDRLTATGLDGQPVDGSTVARARLGPRKKQQYDLQYPVDYRLGQIALKGYDPKVEHLQPGGEMQIRLYWQAVERVDKDYTVFVHVLDSAGKVWAQQDGQPAGGNYPTSLWETGEMVEDVHQVLLPADAPPGTYRVAVGMYLLETLERLPATDAWGMRQTDDRAILWQGEIR